MKYFGLRSAVVRMQARLGFDRTIHDLRRTAMTRMAEIGVDKELIPILLGHARKEVTDVYNRWAYLRAMREALELWANHLRQLPHPRRQARRGPAADLGLLAKPRHCPGLTGGAAGARMPPLLAQLEAQLQIPTVGEMGLRRLLEELAARGLDPSEEFARASALVEPLRLNSPPLEQARAEVLVALEHCLGDRASTAEVEALTARLVDAVEEMKRMEGRGSRGGAQG